MHIEEYLNTIHNFCYKAHLLATQTNKTENDSSRPWSEILIRKIKECFMAIRNVPFVYHFSFTQISQEIHLLKGVVLNSNRILDRKKLQKFFSFILVLQDFIITHYSLGHKKLDVPIK